MSNQDTAPDELPAPLHPTFLADAVVLVHRAPDVLIRVVQSRFADTATWQRLLALWETGSLACRQFLASPLPRVA